jgi:hypothetical protein
MGASAALATAGIATAPTTGRTRDARMAGSQDVLLRVAGGGCRRIRVSLVPALAVTLFLLAVIDRGTAGWTRRVPLAAVVLVVFGVAVALLSGLEVVEALRRGVVEGLVAVAFAWLRCATTSDRSGVRRHRLAA